MEQRRVSSIAGATFLSSLALAGQERLPFRVVYVPVEANAEADAIVRRLESATLGVTRVMAKEFAAGELPEHSVCIFDLRLSQVRKSLLDGSLRFGRARLTEAELRGRPTLALGCGAHLVSPYSKIDGATVVSCDEVASIRDPRHPIWNSPFQVLEPVDSRVSRSRPANLLLAKKALERPGSAPRALGFTSAFDAEIMAGASNDAGVELIGIGREASNVRWSFESSPSDLEPAAWRLFLNCLAYAQDHAHEAFVPRLAYPRECLRWRFEKPVEFGSTRAMDCQRYFLKAPVPVELTGDEQTALAWLDANEPFLRFDTKARRLEVDEQCKQLGASNRSLEFLDILAGRLVKDPADKLAVELADRYAPDCKALGLPAWLARHRKDLRFSDWAGYVWLAPPEAGKR